MMPIPTKTLIYDPPVTEATPAAALVSQPTTAPLAELSMFERMVTDPTVDVDKFERLMLMHERQSARRAEEAFNAAMASAQHKMRRVAADADNPQTKSRYASYAALDRALRPIYTEHGFGLSFDTGEGAAPGWVRVLCLVTHAAGFARTYHVDMPADGKGPKGGDVMTLTHAVGASLSYGMRYLLKMIFNVAVGQDDVDGNDPQEAKPARATPSGGYDDWLLNMEIVAGEGWAVFEKSWGASKSEFREHLTRTDAKLLARLRTKARGSK